MGAANRKAPGEGDSMRRRSRSNTGKRDRRRAHVEIHVQSQTDYMKNHLRSYTDPSLASESTGGAPDGSSSTCSTGGRSPTSLIYSKLRFICRYNYYSYQMRSRRGREVEEGHLSRPHRRPVGMEWEGAGTRTSPAAHRPKTYPSKSNSHRAAGEGALFATFP